MIEVSIHLICTKKPGTLSRLIRDIKLFGLIYSSHEIEYQQAHNLITVHGSGKLNCGRNRLIEVLNDLPGVISIDTINIVRNGVNIAQVHTQTSQEKILSREPLTSAILLTAEKRLAETLGPIANFLVETAATNCQNTGELFLTLASELNTESEKTAFLSIIEY